ncbi:alkaline phosphatase family protein [Saprospiraceae bacterium]|nr:alkaline phosphatase family protein [Saprospiraceae bacterium]
MIAISSLNDSLLSNVKMLNTIAFGSCNKTDEDQVLWDDISATDPDLWIWLGDAIYGDTENMKVMRNKYNLQKENTGYEALLQDTPVIGIWDDHDYGINNGDKTFPAKAGSRDAFYDFLDIAEDSKFRSREGAYQSYRFPSVGGKVAVILLDTRYFKDPVKRQKGKYVYDESIDLLGLQQWQWLESELSQDADIIIIGNGTQVIPEDHNYEKWANYPSSRKRLFELLDSVDSKVVLLSGDRHIGELSQMALDNGMTVSEVTSSGMTHTYEGLKEEKNRHRVGTFTTKLNYGLMTITTDSITLQLRGNNNSVHRSISIK